MIRRCLGEQKERGKGTVTYRVMCAQHRMRPNVRFMYTASSLTSLYSLWLSLLAACVNKILQTFPAALDRFTYANKLIFLYRPVDHP